MPEGASTRRNSASISRCSARCSIVSNDTIASIDASGNGSCFTEDAMKRALGAA
jgi:hypothetical protein